MVVWHVPSMGMYSSYHQIMRSWHQIMTSKHMISCTQLHDYGGIQDITRSLRDHGDHYICYKEYTCSAWYLYHRVGVSLMIPMETISSRYMVCAQRMVTWYEVPKRVQIHDLGCLKWPLLAPFWRTQNGWFNPPKGVRKSSPEMVIKRARGGTPMSTFRTLKWVFWTPKMVYLDPFGGVQATSTTRYIPADHVSYGI